MDTPGLHQPPKRKRDPEKTREQQKRYRQRLYAAPNGIEETKALHRRRHYERMDRLKASGEYEAFKAKKTGEGIRRYHAMTEEQRAEVKRKNAQCQRNWMQKMKDKGLYAAYKQRLNARRREITREKKEALGEEGWKALQKQRYDQRMEAIRLRNWRWLDEALEHPFPLPWLPLDWTESMPEEDKVHALCAEALQQIVKCL